MATNVFLYFCIQYQDFLQLMIEATVDDASSNKNRKLTVEEITAYAITFMMAGYETTANSLSYVSYLLALNPRVQEKLQEEIDKFYRENKVHGVFFAAHFILQSANLCQH